MQQTTATYDYPDDDPKPQFAERPQRGRVAGRQISFASRSGTHGDIHGDYMYAGDLPW